MSHVQSGQVAVPKDRIVGFLRQAGSSVGEAALIVLALSLAVTLAWVVTLGIAMIMG